MKKYTDVIIRLPADTARSVLGLTKSKGIDIRTSDSGDTVGLPEATEGLLLKVRLLHPQARFAIRKGRREEKLEVELPEKIAALMNCPNPSCVTSQPKEPAAPEFKVVREEPLTLQCLYCGRYVPKGGITPDLFEVTRFIPPAKSTF
ncbi:MAG: hypothetical protein JRN39_07330 [Nitrososphaerota archaeon]|nr:hypothetical protein [Nitrososphaerota archaeon]